LSFKAKYDSNIAVRKIAKKACEVIKGVNNIKSKEEVGE